MELRKKELLKSFDDYLITVSASKDSNRLIELEIMLKGRLIEIERRKVMNCIKCEADLTEDDYRYGKKIGVCRRCEINQFYVPPKIGVAL